jgi:hypothetical protein
MVEPKDFLKDMVSFQKKSFEKSYTMIENIRGESEKMVTSFLDQSFDATKNLYSQYMNSLIDEPTDKKKTDKG